MPIFGQRTPFHKAFLSAAVLWTGVVLVHADDSLKTAQTDSTVKEKPLEVEIVHVGKFGAMPSEIHRHPGKFILLVINDVPGTADVPASSFVLDAAQQQTPANQTTAGATSTATPQGGTASLHVASFKRQRSRLSTVVDVPAGELDLKSTVSSATLCKITIQ